MIGSLDAQERSLFEWIGQILTALETALPAFAAQAAEQVYKAHPEVSTLFEKRQVKRLQEDIQAAAQERSLRIIGELAHEELWVLSPSRKVREQLHDHPKVWRIVKSLAIELDPILERYGYPAKMGPDGKYFEQTRLLRAEQLPGAEQIKLLTLQYWMNLARYRHQQINTQRQVQVGDERKLDEMWHH